MANNQVEETLQSLSHLKNAPGTITINALTKVHDNGECTEQLVRFIFDTDNSEGRHKGFVVNEEYENLMVERNLFFDDFAEFYALSKYIVRNTLVRC